MTRNITRADLCDAVYKKVGLSRSNSLAMVELVLKEITDPLEKGETVKLSSFGSFIVRKKSQRIGRNPKTGTEATISPRRVVVFKPSAILKQQINGNRSGTKTLRSRSWVLQRRVSYSGFLARSISSYDGMWVFSDQDSSATPQIVQTASPVCGTKNFSSVRLYSARICIERLSPSSKSTPQTSHFPVRKSAISRLVRPLSTKGNH